MIYSRFFVVSLISLCFLSVWSQPSVIEIKKSNNKFIDTFKVIKILLDNKDTLLEPIYYNEEIMNTQFYDKVTEYKTLEYPESCVKYQNYEQKEKQEW